MAAFASLTEAKHEMEGAEARASALLGKRVRDAEECAEEAVRRAVAAEAAAAAAQARCAAATTTLSAVRDASAAALRRMGAVE